MECLNAVGVSLDTPFKWYDARDKSRDTSLKIKEKHNQRVPREA